MVNGELLLSVIRHSGQNYKNIMKIVSVSHPFLIYSFVNSFHVSLLFGHVSCFYPYSFNLLYFSLLSWLCVLSSLKSFVVFHFSEFYLDLFSWSCAYSCFCFCSFVFTFWNAIKGSLSYHVSRFSYTRKYFVSNTLTCNSRIYCTWNYFFPNVIFSDRHLILQLWAEY